MKIWMSVELQKQTYVWDIYLILYSNLSKILYLKLNLLPELADLILEEINILINFFKLALEFFFHLILLAHHLNMKHI